MCRYTIVILLTRRNPIRRLHSNELCGRSLAVTLCATSNIQWLPLRYHETVWVVHISHFATALSRIHDCGGVWDRDNSKVSLYRYRYDQFQPSNRTQLIFSISIRTVVLVRSWDYRHRDPSETLHRRGPVSLLIRIHST